MAPRLVVVTSSHLQAWALLVELGPFQGSDLSEPSRSKVIWQTSSKRGQGYREISTWIHLIHLNSSALRLSPSRKTEVEVALAGSYAGFATALLLCLAGVLRGDASDGLIVLEETWFHELLDFWTRAVSGVEVQSICHGLHIAQTPMDKLF